MGMAVVDQNGGTPNVPADSMHLESLLQGE